MHRDHAVSISFGQKKYAESSGADADGILQHGLEYWLQIAGRRADDCENMGRSRELLQSLVPLAGKPRKLSFLGFSGGTAAAHSWRIAPPRRYRRAASRFSRFAACSGAPSHRPP